MEKRDIKHVSPKIPTLQIPIPQIIFPYPQAKKSLPQNILYNLFYISKKYLPCPLKMRGNHHKNHLLRLFTCPSLLNYFIIITPGVH